MAIVERYAVVLHGSPTGYENNRAFVHLTGAGVCNGRLVSHSNARKLSHPGLLECRLTS